jgi:nicotinamidase/pyrazinamidase
MVYDAEWGCEGVALLVVDVQNDFADPRGSLYVDGAEAIVGLISEAVHSARDAGRPVFYTQDWHPPTTPHFASSGGLWPDHCVRGTWGAELHPELLVEGPVVRKGTGGEDGYSGFTARDPASGEQSDTGLDERLRGAAVRSIVLCGLATDYCVRDTALDALRLGYPTVVLADLVRAVDVQEGDGASALAEVAAAGAELR